MHIAYIAHYYTSGVFGICLLSPRHTRILLVFRYCSYNYRVQLMSQWSDTFKYNLNVKLTFQHDTRVFIKKKKNRFLFYWFRWYYLSKSYRYHNTTLYCRGHTGRSASAAAITRYLTYRLSYKQTIRYNKMCCARVRKQQVHDKF